MAPNSACQTFIPKLSPYLDGELLPADRQVVERHLAACKHCTMRTADLRAESGLLRVGMEMLADEVDFKDFSQQVMAALIPERAPLLERLKLSLSEMFTYQRGLMLTSMATAAVVLAIAAPLILLRNGTPEGYASQRMAVQTVSVDEEAHVAPVVLETEGGDAIIFMVDHTHPGTDESRQDELDIEPEAEGAKLKQQAPKGGDL